MFLWPACVYVCTRVYTCVRACMNACVYVCVCMCVCVCGSRHELVTENELFSCSSEKERERDDDVTIMRRSHLLFVVYMSVTSGCVSRFH